MVLFLSEQLAIVYNAEMELNSNCFDLKNVLHVLLFDVALILRRLGVRRGMIFRVATKSVSQITEYSCKQNLL